MNNKIAPPSYFILFFVIMIFFLPSCASVKDRDIKKWEIVKVDKNDKPTWIIYTRKIVGTDFLEYKIEGAVESSSQACISWFKKDIYNLANGSNIKKYPTYKITEESKDSLLTYVIHNEPFPFKDTEMSVRYIFFNDEDRSTGVIWHEAWNESQVPSLKKFNRVETFRGSWNFTPSMNNSCQAATSVKFDSKKMPMWLVEPMVFKFLRKGLEDLRAITSK